MCVHVDACVCVCVSVSCVYYVCEATNEQTMQEEARQSPFSAQYHQQRATMPQQ